jgi:hypothetical protein
VTGVAGVRPGFDFASSTILLPRFIVYEVKSSVSSGTPGSSRKSSAGSKFRAIAPNTAARSRGFTSSSTSTIALVSESCPVPIRPSAVFIASFANRFPTETTSRLWKPASK